MSSANSSQLADLPDYAAKLAAVVSAYAKEHVFHGTVLVQDKGQIVYHMSFGVADRAFNVPTTNGTKYRIASITKLFTAVLILQLFEQGKLDVHAPMKRYVPDFTVEGMERITIHHLLNHTSGLPNTDVVKTYEEAVQRGIEIYQKPSTTDELAARYCVRKPVHEPGEKFDYNNGEYILLGKVIEKLTGMTYEAALQKYILGPLEMNGTGMLYQRTILENLANTYFQPHKDANIVNDMPVYIENWYTAGGLYSDTTDLLKFANALFGGQLLKPDTFSRMLTPGLDNYGYGIWASSITVGEKQRSIAHRPGSIMGANTVLLRFLDDDLTVIILSNTNTTDIDDFSFTIGRTVLG